MIRRLRPPYIPAWGDEKQRQAIRSASLCQFGRTSSPGRPAQPWPDADLKVWRRVARRRGNLELVARLEDAFKARQRS